MKREQIERLAIDAAAGQLNTDARALFEEYLAGHPQAGGWADQMRQMYQTTETVFAEKTKHPVQPDIRRSDAESKPRPIADWRPIARWAAVIAIAACVGTGIGRWTRPPVVEKSQEVSVDTPSTAGGGIDRGDTGGGFWRQKALALFQAQPSAARSGSMSGPTLWEKYRQLIKEKHYE